MRHERYDLEQIMREYMRILAIQTRDRLGLKQKQMADELFMSESSYSDIETGRAGGSALTVVRLLNMQERPEEHLHRLNEKFGELLSGDLQPI